MHTSGRSCSCWTSTRGRSVKSANTEAYTGVGVSSTSPASITPPATTSKHAVTPFTTASWRVGAS